MNTFWLKIAGFVVVALVLVILVKGFLPSGDGARPESETGTFYDQAEKDRQKFLAEPKKLVSPQNQHVQPKQEQVAVEPVQPAQGQPEPAGPTTLYFKELSEIDRIEAERLLNVAVPGRSIGRLPMTGFKLMVDNCREMIRRWPDSWYAFRAKQLLADMPQRYQQRYRVTEEELDLSRFAEPRPGTKPFVVEEPR